MSDFIMEIIQIIITRSYNKCDATHGVSKQRTCQYHSHNSIQLLILINCVDIPITNCDHSSD